MMIKTRTLKAFENLKFRKIYFYFLNSLQTTYNKLANDLKSGHPIN